MADPALPMFYRRVAALDRQRHKDWYYDPDQGYGFTAGTNSIYLTVAEFPIAAREYAIVFARNAEGRPAPAVVVGLRQDENLLVDAGGRWRGDYLPAYVRRYPFILANVPEDGDHYAICIDESCSGFNTAQEGERLVNEAGEHGPALSNTVKLLQEFHQQALLTRQFCEKIDEAKLLEPMQAQVSTGSGARFSLSGFECVAPARLRDIPQQALKDLLDAGHLERVYLHLFSLNNLDRLMRIAGDAADADTPVRARR